MAILKLGKIDKRGIPEDLDAFFKRFHSSMSANLRKKHEFRDESDSSWQPIEPVAGNSIETLQIFLKEAGFMLRGAIDGVFGYHTLAGVRLFQEYVRSVEGKSGIGVPDGIVGPKTQAHIDRWKMEKIVSEWSQFDVENPSEEYQNWINILGQAKAHFLENSNPILDAINRDERRSDTFKVNDWSFNPEDVHLIGIRRGQDTSHRKRANDDIFILLIKGLVFKFWGSTDPSQSMADRTDEPFLVEGQHKYRLGWHKISDEKRVYKALRPYSNGVLVFRDKVNDNALTVEDIQEGIQAPNHTINIHWSGDGDLNFSAGCQVIAGRSYLNHKQELVDCSAFAAKKYAELGSRRTRAAYNVISDLILSYTPSTFDYVLYTLGRDENLNLDATLETEYAEQVYHQLIGRLPMEEEE